MAEVRKKKGLINEDSVPSRRVWDGVLTFDFRVSTFDFREKALLLKLSQVDPSKRETFRRNKVTSATGSEH